MDINYEIIIKYLSKKVIDLNDKQKYNQQTSFITQKNIYTYSHTFPAKFKELLTDKFYKYGITVYDNENNNISFWSSIITLLDKNFIIPYINDECELINQFKLQLIELYNKKLLSDFIKKYDKNDLRERFKLNPDLIVLQYIVDILDINIIIFNFKTETINVLYSKDIMNPWKQSILLANDDMFWEPIMCIKSKNTIIRLFDYNSQTFKKIINNNLITYLNGSIIGKKFVCINNLSDIIELEKKKLNIISKKSNLLLDNNSDSSVHTDEDIDDNKIVNIFIKEDEFYGLNKTTMTKMKISELIGLTNKLNIVITKKNPTKAILMESILNKINVN
jgi:hypothetical protein